MQSGTDRHIKLFDSIAGPYNLFFPSLRKHFGNLIREHGHRLQLPAGCRVLDVGCGPGALAAAFIDAGFRAEAIDGSPRMAGYAAKNGVPSQVADATSGLPYPDGAFQLAAAASVAHGLPSDSRNKLYLELKRVASDTVLLHDYSPAHDGFSPFSIIGILERLEKSDYIGFRRNAKTELQSLFSSVEIVPINARSSWYICR